LRAGLMGLEELAGCEPILCVLSTGLRRSSSALRFGRPGEDVVVGLGSPWI
jgi:hypothetical protein